MNEPYVVYHENDNISSIKYFQNDKLHRLDGPALIFYYEDGKIWSKEFFQDGYIHKIDGPALIQYFENGNMFKENIFKMEKCIEKVVQLLFFIMKMGK